MIKNPALILIILGTLLVGFSPPTDTGIITTQIQSSTLETSEFRLGMDYYQGKNDQKAMEYFRQAAEAGDLLAVVQIGLMYDFGRGVQQDYAEARKWYLRAAGNGEPRAMYLVGHMYEYGEGVSVNPKTAFDWYLKSAQQGHSSAQFEIGKILTRTSRDSESYYQGVEWLKLAANQCHSKALETLQFVSEENSFKNPACCGG